MRDAAVEEVGVARAEHLDLIAHRDFKFPFDDDAAFARVVLEHGRAGIGSGFVALMEDLQIVGLRIAHDGGAALFIDYGRASPEPGDTLQAVRLHERVSALETAGEADLTVHADFPAFAAAARTAGVETTPIRSQAEFLEALGIRARAAALVAAQPQKAAVVERQLARLTAADQMGALFKAVCVHSPGLPIPGFED